MNCPCCGLENKFTTLYCIRCGQEIDKETPMKVRKTQKTPFSSLNWECIKTIYTPDPKNPDQTAVKSLSLHQYGEIIAVVRKCGTLEIKRIDGENSYILNNPGDKFTALDAVFPCHIIDSVTAMVESVPMDKRDLFPSSTLELYEQEKELDRMNVSGGIPASPENKIISLDSDGMVRIWDFPEKKVVRKFPAEISKDSRLVISPDNKRIAVSGKYIEIFKISNVNQKRIVCRDELYSFPSTLKFFPDGVRLLSASSQRIGVWNTSLGQLVRSLSKNKAPVTSLCFSDNGLEFVSGDEVGGLVVWDGVSLTFSRTLGTNIKGKAPGKINDICFLPGTDYFFTASENRIIILWKTDEDVRICSMEGHKGPVTALCVSRDGKTLISGDKSGEIKFWKPCG